ncbi:MAG: hypothetical protein AAF390_17245, partial [Pseudomonadota bacterium]
MIRASQVDGVPLNGTGLRGTAWADGTRIGSLDDLREVMATSAPTATFEIDAFGFASRESDTSIAEFLGETGRITSGDGDAEMGPSGLLIEGFIYIPPGQHTITVLSDDGFDLSIGGVAFTSVDARRG